MTTCSQDACRRMWKIVERTLNAPKASPPSEPAQTLQDLIAEELDAVRIDEREQCATRVEACHRAKRAMNSEFARIHAAADVAYRDAANACRSGWSQPEASGTASASPSSPRCEPGPGLATSSGGTR